jgi:uncharacterized membrane protein
MAPYALERSPPARYRRVEIQYGLGWDGIFHLFTWISTAVGLGLLWRAGKMAHVPWRTRLFVGSLMLGWGIFNLVEGLIDHQLLGVHHVHPQGLLSWDLAFLASGVALIGGGLWLVRSRQPRGPR